MNVAPKKSPPAVVNVLVVQHADGYQEAFANEPDGVRVNVKFARIPEAPTRADEVLSEDCFELSLKPPFRAVWRADYFKANGFAAPLKPSTALAALHCQDAIDALNKFADAEERTVWTL